MPIICGVDFSEPGKATLAAAAALAARSRGSLTLVHAFDDRGALTRFDNLRAPLLSRFQELLRHESERLREKGLSVDFCLLTGAPDEAIVEYARREKAELVVVSALGHRSASSRRVGSVAERIAETLAMPVLVVRNAEPFTAWARGQRPLRVMIGVDFSPTADAALEWAVWLRRMGPCDLVLNYVYWPLGERRRVAVHESEKPPLDYAPADAALAEELAARVGKLPGEGMVRIRARAGYGRSADHLVQAAEEEQADLIVVGTHQRHGLDRLWHGSVSRGVLHQATMNVACVPTRLAEKEEPALPPSVTRSVLVPTDLSPFSVGALPYAYRLADGGAVVHLLHIVEPGSTPNPLDAPYALPAALSPEDRAKRLELITERLRAHIPADAAARGVETRIEIVETHQVAETICEAAARLGVDLICMGSHGGSGLLQIAAGSVAQAVLSRSERPVLLYRPARDRKRDE